MFSLVVKSYYNDLNRADRLVKSIREHNQDNLPTYLIAPREDLSAFRDKLGSCDINYLVDEDILDLTMGHSKSPKIDLPPVTMQQVVKSEFWRLNLADNFLIIDSDSYFIRNFTLKDFMFDDHTPYTIMNEGRHQLDWAARAGNERFIRDYHELREKALSLFARTGPHFDFAPTPMICSSKVWKAMYEKVAKPSGESFYDQIERFPCETQWYGEFLLHDQTIPIIPREPLFKVWGFEEQWKEGMSLGETNEILAKNYLGVIDQSYWSRSLDAYSKSQKRKIKWRKRINRILRKLKK
jgi:hypothetical protein